MSVTSSDPLADLLDRSTVRILSQDKSGTGFFVAPGLLLTCAHVIGESHAQQQKIKYSWQGETYIAQLERLLPDPCPPDDIFPDLALLSTDLRDPPSVLLLPGYRDRDNFYSFGYSGLRPGGESLSADCEGNARYDETSPERHLIKFKGTQVLPGISGSPLLNRRTGAVCGVVKRTRDENNDLGGLAIRIELALSLLPELTSATSNSSNATWCTAALKSGSRISPFQAPPVPAYVIDRRQAAPVKKELLSSGARTGALRITALHGMGGIGKTTLAATVAADFDVRGRFPDGVLWATLGRDPRIDLVLENWLPALGGTATRDQDRNVTQLRTLLNDRACLVILDDLWEKAHAEPLLAGGDGCHILVTTRRVVAADDLGARRIELTTLSAGEAIQLLEARMDRAVEPAERRQVHEILKLVGFLPMAVEQIGKRARRGVIWTELIQALKEDIPRLEALEDARTRLGGISKIYASINLSLRYIRNESQDQWARFAWLGVYPEDVDLHAAQCSSLWGVTCDTADTLLEIFADESLLTLRSAITISGRQWRTYRLHDIIHDCARRLLTTVPPEGLGSNMRDAHRDLISRYRKNAAKWSLLPRDGYIQNFLGWHLAKAELSEELEALVSSENEHGGNEWFETRVAQHEPAGYMADLARASEVVENEAAKQFYETGTAPAISKRLRHALIRSSIYSQADQVPESMLAAAVKLGIWSPEEALDRAKQVTEISERIPMLMAVARSSPDPFPMIALSLSFEFASGLPEDRFRANWFGYLAPWLTESLLLQALSIIDGFPDSRDRQSATMSVIPRWIELGKEDEALNRTLSLDHWSQADAVFRMAPLLSAAGVDRSASILKTLQSGEGQKAFAALAIRAAQLGSTDKASALWATVKDKEVKRAYRSRFETARQNEKLGAPLQNGLAEHAQTNEALKTAKDLSPDDRRRALANLASSLDQAQARQALAILERIGDDKARHFALIALSPYLEAAQADAVWAWVESLNTSENQRGVIDDFGTTLIMLTRRDPSLASRVAKLFATIPDKAIRLRALLRLVPWLPKSEGLQIAFEFIYGKIGNPFSSPHLRDALPVLPSAVRTALQDVAPEAIGREFHSAMNVEPETVQLLFDLCAPEVGFQVINELEDRTARFKALAFGANRLPDDLRTAAIIELQKYTGLTKYPGVAIHLAKGVDYLVPEIFELAVQELGEETLPEIGKFSRRLAREGRLDEVRRLRPFAERGNFYVDYLTETAPFFPEPEKWDLITEALRAAAAVRNATFARANYFRFYDVFETSSLACTLPADILLKLFLKVLKSLEAHRREEFFYDLAGLIPILIRLGGAEVGKVLSGDISLVTRWWP